MFTVLEWKNQHRYADNRVCNTCFYCHKNNAVAYVCALAEQETGKKVNVLPRQGRCDAYVFCREYQLQHKISWDSMIEKRQCFFHEK